jgi:hypothetical protein
MRNAGLIALVALACACSTPAQKEPPMTNMQNASTGSATTDEPLVARVRAAVAARTAFTGLAAYVGEKPLFDTTTGVSPDALQHVDFAADPAHPDERFVRDGARPVVYWRRAVPGDDPHIVGVQGDGSAARVFFAIILPPG